MALKDLALATDGDLLINDAGDFEIIDAGGSNPPAVDQRRMGVQYGHGHALF